MTLQRTDDMEVGVEEDGAVFVGGLTLIHSGVSVLDVLQYQHTTRYTPTRIVVHLYTAGEEKSGEKEDGAGEEVKNRALL